ncbi:MAG: hypothetical protein U5M50_15805 [Sphingobium sp.]|nr:hypothetical protein [Sphingobium sp.]
MTIERNEPASSHGTKARLRRASGWAATLAIPARNRPLPHPSWSRRPATPGAATLVPARFWERLGI